MENTIAIFDKNYDLAVIYGGDGVDDILSVIHTEVESVVSDVESVQGRKDIASMAHKVSKSKVALDNLGKDLVKGWKDNAKKVDADRKKVRDDLDALRDSIRGPLTKWEAEQEAVKQAKELAAKIAVDYDEAVGINSLVDREREISRKEAEIAEAEAMKAEAEAAKQAEIDRAAHDARIAEEAKLKAEQDSARKIADAEQKRVDDARIAEQRRINDIRETEERIAREQADKDRLAREKLEQEKAEAARIAAEEEKAAQSLANKRKVNKSALDAMVAGGISEDDAKKVIKLIAKGRIPRVVINY